MFSKTLVEELHFQNSQVDPDVWIRPTVRDDGFEYFEMILVYVEDILCVSEHPDTIMDFFGKFYLIKDGDTSPPKIYLGANIGKFQNPNGKEVWEMSAEDYCVISVKNVETMLQEVGYDGINRTNRQYTAAMNPN